MPPRGIVTLGAPVSQPLQPADCIAPTHVQIAATRARYGYRKMRVLLQREGYPVSENRLYRLHRKERLLSRYRLNRKRRAQMSRPARAKATASNQVWSLDVVADPIAIAPNRIAKRAWLLNPPWLSLTFVSGPGNTFSATTLPTAHSAARAPYYHRRSGAGHQSTSVARCTHIHRRKSACRSRYPPSAHSECG